MIPEFNFHVRRATYEDLPALAEVHASSILEIAPAFYPADIVSQWGMPRDIEKYRTDMDDKGGIYFVAESTVKPDYILGYSVYTYREDKHNLSALYVRGTATRQGIGRALSDAVEDFARKNGAKEIELEAALSAEAFYKTYGFKEIDRRTSLFNKDSPLVIETILMKKSL